LLRQASRWCTTVSHSRGLAGGRCATCRAGHLVMACAATAFGSSCSLVRSCGVVLPEGSRAAPCPGARLGHLAKVPVSFVPWCGHIEAVLASTATWFVGFSYAAALVVHRVSGSVACTPVSAPLSPCIQLAAHLRWPLQPHRSLAPWLLPAECTSAATSSQGWGSEARSLQWCRAPPCGSMHSPWLAPGARSPCGTNAAVTQCAAAASISVRLGHCAVRVLCPCSCLC
jgi:hypothetical protein